jgi:hypothetical protein
MIKITHRQKKTISGEDFCELNVATPRSSRGGSSPKLTKNVNRTDWL